MASSSPGYAQLPSLFHCEHHHLDLYLFGDGRGSLTLVGAGNLIKSSKMPIVFHVLRMLHRNLIIVLHNAIVLEAIWPFVRWSLILAPC